MLLRRRTPIALVATADVVAISLLLAPTLLPQAAFIGLSPGGHRVSSSQNALYLIALAIIWITAARLCGLFDQGIGSFKTVVLQAAKASGLITLALAVHLCFSRPMTQSLVAVGTCFLLALAYSAVRTGLFCGVIQFRPARRESVLILGSERQAQRAWRELRIRHHKGTHFLGFVDDCDLDAIAPDIRGHYRGSLADLPHLLLANAVDSIVIATSSSSCHEPTQKAIAVARKFGVQVLYLNENFPQRAAIAPAGRDSSEIFLDPLQQDHRKSADLTIKYAMDKIGALALLILFFPALCLVYPTSRFLTDGPVLTFEQRFGYRRRPFRMFSFNTTPKMVAGLPSTSAGQVTETRPRSSRKTAVVVWACDLLHRTYLDRLPRLLNVLAGEMSLIGPEPMETPGGSPLVDSLCEQLFRARPGVCRPSKLTARIDRTLSRTMEADAAYQNGWSFRGDLSLVGNILLNRSFRSARTGSPSPAPSQQWANMVESAQEIAK